MASKQQMKCNKCRCSLTLSEVRFSYLGSYVSIEALRCPKCGNILISEELVDERIRSCEIFLEDRKVFQSN